MEQLSYEERLKSLVLFSLEEDREKFIVEIYKIMKVMKKPDVKLLPSKSCNVRTRGHSVKVVGDQVYNKEKKIVPHFLELQVVNFFAMVGSKGEDISRFKRDQTIS